MIQYLPREVDVVPRCPVFIDDKLLLLVVVVAAVARFCALIDLYSLDESGVKLSLSPFKGIVVG